MKSSYRFTLGLIIVILALVSTGCTTSYNTVFVKPPNYGIVIDLNNPSSQTTTGSQLDGGKLMDVTQQTITVNKCVQTLQSTDYCPDVMVVEVPGSFVTRNYTAEANSGTSAKKQSLCFEANGANSCVDFTVTAKVLRKDAICYANRVGINAVKDNAGNDLKYYSKAVDLATTMDDRVVGIASGLFSMAVAKTSPLSLALEKYTIFDNVKQDIIDALYTQTCITVTKDDIRISNGIVWADPTIQDQINQATIIANQLELLKKKNDLLKQQTEALLDRAKVIESQYGLDAAIKFLQIQTEQMKIDKWSGDSWLPFLNPTPDYVPVATPAPVPTPAP